ncbi:hypothetical protein [Demequina sp.]|uniref:hypothetical protein n=1 Tax=Demequina sp. TaxID=2050685 RepID=UPI003D14454A
MADFVPALSVPEAEARIFAIAGTTLDRSTRGPKRALRALANAVGLDAPLQLTNEELSLVLAEHLGVRVVVDLRARHGGYLQLEVFNDLLLGAWVYFNSHPLPRPASLPPQFDGPEWDWFKPARSKLEAVNLISALTQSGPEDLGPGGKERKRVFVNLANRMGLSVNTDLSKIELGEAIAQSLGVIWTDTCASTGYTITLEGLNVVLAGAAREMRRRGTAVMSPAIEAAQILGVLKNEFDGGAVWDGRTSIVHMRDAGYNHWRQPEWPGWYFEFRGLAALAAALGTKPASGPEQRYGNTYFDYAHNYVWDLKSHVVGKLWLPERMRERGDDKTILNDKVAMEHCVARDGLGLIVMEGIATFDRTGEFYAWVKDATATKASARRTSNTGHSRPRKSAFEPTELLAYRWDNPAEFAAAVASGAVSVWKQPRQPRNLGELQGAARRDKYQMSSKRSQPWVVAATTF